MRSEIGKLSLDSLFEERETLNDRIVSAIEKESMEWGVHSIRYEIKYNDTFCVHFNKNNVRYCSTS